MMPAVSLITATRNSAKTLRSCLESIAAQTVTVEHVVIDGGSTDGTLEIVAAYRDRIAVLVSEPDSGLYDALNKGITSTTGEIVGILHADDFYPTPDVLARVVRVFEDPAVDACYGDLLYVREKPVEKLNCAAHVEAPPAATLNHLQVNLAGGSSTIQPFNHSTVYKIVRYWQSGSYHPQKFYQGWMPPHPTLFVRRSIYERCGLFRLDLGTAADYELMLRFLVRHRINAYYLPGIMVCMRIGGVSNRSFAARLRANRMDRLAWSVNDLTPSPWTLWFKPLRKLSQWWRRP